ncbi:acyltransferase family protein [Noviherbaspirillum sedimenti]|uniref:Acyltransferase n=1 Tax=Noviherbaspirillum sedimenti TaxID=2320865 RepID=A0A3A3FXR7_9BURK|nr:acyltransferase [Noviherbaspirillum sedimenti]RJG00998.1 acyltransferase [Noviherbaspirillum sedimenti]
MSGTNGESGAKQAQFFLINCLKAGAAQLIVLHHLAFYGPMSDHALPLMPAIIDWLDTYGRIAVQVFLVIGGFLVAKSLSPQGQPGLANPLGSVLRRYAKLAPPFVVAMLLAIGASAWAGLWMTDESISAPPEFLQFGAHVLLLQDVLDHESLSAGAWYVAIDFQLYALMALLLWLCGRLAGERWLPWLPWLMPVVVAAGVSVSLLYFNRNADWDMWAPYFFGSYGLGILAWWASDPARRRGAVALLLSMMLLPSLAALAVDFRSRIAVALVVAGVLFFFGRARLTHSGRGFALINRLGQISYSVFLVHFPVCLVVNAAFNRFIPAEAHWQAAGMLIGWAASLAAGAAFFRWVEVPLGRISGVSGKPTQKRGGG